MADASRDGNGTFVREYDWTDDAANSIPITASRFDEEMDGVASELTNSVAADGQTTMSGALKMGSQKITGGIAGTALTDFPIIDQITDNALTYLGTTAGTTTAYTLSPSPAITGYVKGMEFSFEANADNTASSTVAISGLAATTFKKIDSAGAKQNIAAGDLQANITYAARYDGTDFLLTDNIGVGTASTTVEGVVELATAAEVKTGTDTARVAPVSALIGHEGVCKAWVLFDATGTLSVYDSFNVTSVTDNGVGLFTINFTTAFGSANYSPVGFARIASGGSNVSGFVGGNTSQANPTTSACPVVVWSDGGTNVDVDYISVAFFGDR